METLNHPLDVQYETFSSEGWPLLVCELWDRTHTGVRSLIGCGVTWLPQHGDHGSATNTPSSFGGNASTQSGGAFGASTLEVPLWRPQFRHREENSVGEIWSYEDVAGQWQLSVVWPCCLLSCITLPCPPPPFALRLVACSGAAAVPASAEAAAGDGHRLLQEVAGGGKAVHARVYVCTFNSANLATRRAPCTIRPRQRVPWSCA